MAQLRRRSRAALRGTIVSLGLAATTAAPAAVCRADDPQSHGPFVWDPAWSHADAWDYLLSAGGLTTLGIETAALQIGAQNEPVRWSGPILFDQPVRDLFRGLPQNVRDNAATASWVLWFAEVGYPFAVDVPYASLRYGPQVGWDLFWQDTTAMALASVVDFTLRDTVDRARPFISDCLQRGGTDCLTGPESTRSFPSGHVTETSTAAALVCTQHLTMNLYGAPWDAVTCASAIAVDVSVAVLRLMTDNHYASDVLAGGALGLAFGWGVPTLMHLHGRAPSGPAVPRLQPAIMAAPGLIKLGVGAAF